MKKRKVKRSIYLLYSVCTFLFFLSLSEIIFSAPVFSKEETIITNNIRVIFPNFTILDSNLKNDDFYTLLNAKLESKLSNIPNFKLIKTQSDFKNLDLLVSDEILSITKDLPVDFVITGSLTKLNNDIILNLRVYETITGKISYTKQYIFNKNDMEANANLITDDLISFSKKPEAFGFGIANMKLGKAEIRVKSTPEGSRLFFDGKEYGRTPFVFQEISETQHLIEIMREKESFINIFNLISSDEKVFQSKVQNIIYNDSNLVIEDLKEKEISVEIFADTTESKTSRKFKLQLLTEPEDAAILINGIPIPREELDLFPGKYKVKVLDKKLFMFKKIIDSNKENIAKVDLKLYKLGRVLLSTNPENAEIIVDEDTFGFTPKSLEIPLGKHYLELRRDGFSPETYLINVEEGITKEMKINLTSLKNTNTTTAYLPTGLTDNLLGVSSIGMSLGQYSVNDTNSFFAYLYGGEVNYGLKNLLSVGKYLNFGFQVGAFYNQLGTFGGNYSFPDNKGVSGKIQFLNQSDLVPVSVAVGSFYNFSKPTTEAFNGYIAATRDFGSFSFDLGTQFQLFRISALNLNLNYNRFYRFKTSLSLLINFNLLTSKKEERITPIIGLNIGYNFF